MLTNLFNRFLHKIAFVAPGGHGLRPRLHKMRGAKIGKNVWISQFVYIDELHPEAVTIGDNSTIGLRSSIFTHFYWGHKKSEYNVGKVVIEHDVFIGPHCVILPNVQIGKGSVIKAGSVITRDVPPYTFWGPPSSEPLGRVTVPLTHEHTFEEFIAGLKPIRRRKTDWQSGNMKEWNDGDNETISKEDQS